MRISVYGNTDTGLVREHNEDSFFISPVEPLYVVADGMGGHNSGEVASRLAVETIEAFYRRTAGRENIDLIQKSNRSLWPFGKKRRTAGYEELRLEMAIHEANREIIEDARRDDAKQGMGTTVVAVYYTDSGVFVGHVGDSRCYLFRDGTLTQVSEDHSLANEYVKMNILSKEDAVHFPYKNVIVRALGLAEQVQVDIQKREFRPNDLFLLCSDGLSDMINSEQIAAVLRDIDDVGEAAEELIARAKKAGGADNITVILARVEPE